MPADDFDPMACLFTQADAVALTQADNDTIDNWVRYKHVVPMRVGNRRLFSFSDLLRIDLIHMLQRLFKAEIHVSAHLANEAAKAYIPAAEIDRSDILAGEPWNSPVARWGDATIGLTRDKDGTLRATEPGDMETDSVHIILPVRTIGRRILAGVNDWAEKSA